MPHITAASFDKISLPFTIANATIKAIVLDKDNCFAKDHDDKVYPAYEQVWLELQKHYPKERILIVSNSAGTSDDKDFKQAQVLESSTGVTVLRHATKKPGCHPEVLEYFKKQGLDNPQEILVIGDRLFTDILMANMMGSYGLWLFDGVEKSQKIFPVLERKVYQTLTGNSV